MRLVSFDPLRTAGFPRTTVLKPERYLEHVDVLAGADAVLYPEAWQVNAIEYGLRRRIFPSPASYRLGRDKVEMTRAFLAVAPGHVPTTVVEANEPERRAGVWDRMDAPFVAKLPRASGGEGVWLIETRSDWARYCERTDMLYAQERLPIDRDLRVVVVGRDVLTAYWRRAPEGGFHNNVARGGSIEHQDVPEAALDLVRDTARALGVDHAGFDVALVGGHPYLLEFNRLFGTRGVSTAALNAAILAHLRALCAPMDPDHSTRPPGGLRPAA